VEALAEAWTNGFRGNLESWIQVDIQSAAQVKQGPLAKGMAPALAVLEQRIATNRRQLEDANRIVTSVVGFLPEIQKTKSEILTIGSKP